MTVCPRHRDSLGTRWRSGKTICPVPAQKKASRGDRGINTKQSQLVWKEAGTLLPVGTRESLSFPIEISRYNYLGYLHKND